LTMLLAQMEWTPASITALCAGLAGIIVAVTKFVLDWSKESGKNRSVTRKEDIAFEDRRQREFRELFGEYTAELKSRILYLEKREHEMGVQNNEQALELGELKGRLETIQRLEQECKERLDNLTAEHEALKAEINRKRR
jgi:hypothetical protein